MVRRAPDYRSGGTRARDGYGLIADGRASDTPSRAALGHGGCRDASDKSHVARARNWRCSRGRLSPTGKRTEEEKGKDIGRDLHRGVESVLDPEQAGQVLAVGAVQ